MNPENVVHNEKNESNGLTLEGKDSATSPSSPPPSSPPSPPPSLPAESEIKPEVKETKESLGGTEDSQIRRKDINNPFGAITSKVSHLVYWENPIHSCSILGIGLAIIIFTSMFSLLNAFFAIAIGLLVASWACVVVWKQSRILLNKEYSNPLNTFIGKSWYIERGTVEKYLDVLVDSVNFVLQESRNVISSEDPFRTLKHALILYLTWTILGWFSIHTLAFIVIVLGFSVPTAYQSNKTFVDEKFEKVYGISNCYLERTTGLVKHHTKGVFEKGRSLAATKGWGVKEE